MSPASTPIPEISILWLTAGLSCDGDTIAMTAATQPSLEDVLRGAIPWIPKVRLYNPFLSIENGDELPHYGSEVPSDAAESRDAALLYSLVSAHTILRVTDASWVSLLDPPTELRDMAARCENVGTWPVLVGEPGQRDTMLSSPIIIYDYPEIAPESAGDLFDGTEIDEILSLRIMTLTDAEKVEMRSSDERARRILERTESLGTEEMLKMHGIMRPVGGSGGEAR